MRMIRTEPLCTVNYVVQIPDYRIFRSEAVCKNLAYRKIFHVNEVSIEITA